MNAGRLAAGVLADGGVRYAFGLIGSTVADFLDALADDPRLRVLSVRHEQVAAHMADAAARLTGRPSVCFAHAMPGSLNLMLGVGTAWRDSSPVIAVTGDVERERFGREAWQAFDEAVDVFRPLTKWSYRIERPEEVERICRQALSTAVSGRPGPVHLQLPRDVSRAPAVSDGRAAADVGAAARGPLPDPAAVASAAACLSAAERPVLLVGGGVIWSRAEAELAELAQRLQAPVIVSQTSRGALSETGPLCLGASGLMGNAAADRALREADVVLAVGSRLSDLQTGEGRLIGGGQTLIQVDLDGRQFHRQHPAGQAVVADARAFLTALIAALPGAPAGGGATRLGELVAERDAGYAARLSPGTGFGPREVVAAVHAVAPADAVVSIGAGRHAQFAADLPRVAPRTHLKAIGSATMGFAFPAALAAKAVDPGRAAIALVGDGDFLMSVHDLETAVRERLAAVTIVFDDFRLASQAEPGRRVGVEHGNPEFAPLARCFGAAGFEARSYPELCTAIEAALACGQPAVVDARLTD